MSLIKFTKKRKGRRLTWFSRFLILIIFMTAFYLIFRQLNSFLCITNPIQSKTLVLEGWLPDYALQEMIEYYQQHEIEKIIITGIPIERGYYASEYRTYADIALANLATLGFDTGGIVKINLPRNILKDRTYTTALALKEKLHQLYPDLKTFNIFTLGCHARRSHLLFKKAFGDAYKIGIISAQDKSYNYDTWMASSRGFRTVTNEGIAYFYASVVFSPDDNYIKKQLAKGYYLDALSVHREEKDQNFRNADTTPLTEEQIADFVGLNYFPVNQDYLVKASFRIDTSGKVFKMKTTTDRLPEYRKFAVLSFKLNGKEHKLNAYQNMAFINHPRYHKYLFIPLRDLSSGEETYGGGRYLDLKIMEKDSILIDFNYLYNPYCSYNDRYSCPIPPEENFVDTKILAGEKTFDAHH